ncbi:response regulator [Acidovorax sp. LjRoot129]|uniref:response regulator n=1 Tax=Acidovorax sp. LjRoot129 TaxID=3342260 RepID=UPI003ED01D2E
MELFEEVDILLVEDSPNDAELAIRALKKRGFANKMLWVKDGEQAINYLFRRGEYSQHDEASPKLVLLDLKMPRVDGMEVLRVMKEDQRTRRIPVVMLTSSQEERDVAQSYDLGVNSYVVKPMDFGEMADVVCQAGSYWLGVNRTP